MRILVIDDEPIRANNFVKAGHDVKIAHGFDQIRFWLDHGPFDLICLDHDMPLMNGTSVVKEFGIELIAFPIHIWSHNISAKEKMIEALYILAEENDLPLVYNSWAFKQDKLFFESIFEWLKELER